MRTQEVEPRVSHTIDHVDWVIMHALRKAIKPILQKHVKEDDFVVEVGAGNGRFSRVFPETVGQLVHVDNDFSALQTFHSLEPGAQLVQGDAKRGLPFPDASVDALVMLAGYGIFNLQESLEEAKRILKPKGKLLLFQDLGMGYDPNGMAPKREVETAHQGIMAKATKMGLRVADGYGTTEQYYVGDLQAFLENLSEEERRKIMNGFSPTEVLLGFASVFSDTELMSSLKGGEKSILKHTERLLGVSFPKDMRFTPGKEYVEYIKMRYLVLQKQ